jgi:hypothetical protein
MADLIERLRARLDEDERVANGVIGERWYFDLIDDGKRAYEDRFTAERQLRWVAAARQNLDAAFHYESVIDGEWGCCHDAEEISAGECWGVNMNANPLVLALASVYGEGGDG